MQRKYRVGRDCQSWCTKCKDVVEHTVIAMLGSLPKRVECLVCGSQHNFRLPADSNPGAKRSTANRKSSPRIGRGGLKSLLAALETESSPRSYRMSETFSVNDILEHPHFGTGVVRGVVSGDKIEVLFESGTKILAQGR